MPQNGEFIDPFGFRHKALLWHKLGLRPLMRSAHVPVHVTLLPPSTGQPWSTLSDAWQGVQIEPMGLDAMLGPRPEITADAADENSFLL